MGRTRFDAVPALSRKLRVELEDRIKSLEEYSENCPYNFIEWNDKKIGIITSGVSYNYAKEVFGDKASYFKLGLHIHFIRKIADFARGRNTLLIEELIHI